MANHMAEVAKMLGVEMNEDFECKDSGFIYRITDKGLTCNGVIASDCLMMILRGELTIKRQPWNPKDGEINE